MSLRSARWVAASSAGNQADFPKAFSHLERLQNLSQRFAFAHAARHLCMLPHGWRTHGTCEVFR
ncbi:DUF3703 domain-containing protein [Halopseudomonas sp.]|uniref:DUF3703 domain-containing protein n=1 Tax=Halopseudomonas sp. TaxID=2901191 RepID=UPI00300132A0